MSEQAPYQYVDPDAFLQRHQEAMAEREYGGRSWTPKVGPVGKPLRNVIRGMPPHLNMGRAPIIKMKVHFSLGPNTNVAAPCLEPYSKPCPACEWVNSLFGRSRAETDPVRKGQFRDMAFKQRSKLRYGMNIIDMAEPHKGVQPYWFNQEVYDDLVGCFYDDNVPPQFRDITHPETGRDVIMEVSKKQGTDWNQYDMVRPKDTASPLINPQWLFEVADLTDHIYEPTLHEVTMALQGQRIERASRSERMLAGGGAAVAVLPAAPAAVSPVPPPVVVTPTTPPPPRGPIPMPPVPPAVPTPPPAARVPMAPPAAAPPPPAPVPPPPAPPVAVAAPTPAPPVAVPPPVPAAPPVAVAAPPPVPSAPPAASPRGGGRGGRRAQAPVPGVVSSPSAIPSAPPPPAAPPLVVATAAPAAGNGADQYPHARQEIYRLEVAGIVKPGDNNQFFTPWEPTAEELGDPRRPPCFLLETVPEDPACQGCSMLLPCLQGRIMQVPGSRPWTYPQAA